MDAQRSVRPSLLLSLSATALFSSLRMTNARRNIPGKNLEFQTVPSHHYALGMKIAT
jgi:hypothetical protein